MRRKIVVLHLFFIPFLPLGIRRVWLCEGCDQSPYRADEAREAVWVGPICLAVATLLALFCITNDDKGNGFIWILFAISGLGGLHFMRKWRIIRRAKREAILKAQETETDHCLNCGGPIRPSLPTVCYQCDLTIYSIEKVP